MNKAEHEQLVAWQRERLERLMWMNKGDLAERLVRTRALFGRPRALVVDPHTHSTFSDGRGTVADNVERAKACGIDFLFATDHGSIKQKRVVAEWPDVSWGQEPGAGPHHIGLLCNDRLFVPADANIAGTLERARKSAAFAWIPHPAGWYPATWYSDAAIETLWTLGQEFAVEVMNGANKVVRAYDAFDAKAVTVWDRLLCDGRKVTALGASDAHCPGEIGSNWTGVFSTRCEERSITKALRAGACFASEAAMLRFACNGAVMGRTVSAKKGAKLELTFRVADADGIASIRIVSQGRVVKEWRVKDDTLVEGCHTVKARGKPAYYRLECTSSDDRRAFSTPVYVS